MGQFDAIRQQVVDACQSLVEKGYLAGTGGNVSVRIARQDAFAITPSNYDYARMRSEDICVLGLDLEVLEGEMKPSLESGIHATVYQKRLDVKAVIHTHQAYASALALVKAPIPALFDEQVRFLGRSVEIIPYAPSGTWFLKNNIASRLKNHHNAYILQNHGVLCMGGTIERAVHNVELLEKCSLAYLLALCAERKVTRIPLAVREIAFARLRADQKKMEEGKSD